MTGAAASVSASAPCGNSWSIQDDVTSDLVRFVILFGCFRGAVTPVTGLISGHAEVSHRPVAVTDLALPWLDVPGPACVRYPASVDDGELMALCSVVEHEEEVTVGTSGTHGEVVSLDTADTHGEVVTAGTVGKHESQSKVIGLLVLDEQATPEAGAEEISKEVDDELFLAVMFWSEVAVSAIKHGLHGLVMLAVVRSLIPGWLLCMGRHLVDVPVMYSN